MPGGLSALLQVTEIGEAADCQRVGAELLSGVALCRNTWVWQADQMRLLTLLFLRIIDIHSRQIRLAVSLHHAQKLPAIPLIESRMICDQVQGFNPK